MNSDLSLFLVNRLFLGQQVSSNLPTLILGGVHHFLHWADSPLNPTTLTPAASSRWKTLDIYLNKSGLSNHDLTLIRSSNPLIDPCLSSFNSSIVLVKLSAFRQFNPISPNMTNSKTFIYSTRLPISKGKKDSILYLNLEMFGFCTEMDIAEGCLQMFTDSCCYKEGVWQHWREFQRNYGLGETPVKQSKANWKSSNKMLAKLGKWISRRWDD